MHYCRRQRGRERRYLSSMRLREALVTDGSYGLVPNRCERGWCYVMAISLNLCVPGRCLRCMSTNATANVRFVLRRAFLTGGGFVLGSLFSLMDRSGASELTEMEALKGKDYGKPQMRLCLPPCLSAVQDDLAAAIQILRQQTRVSSTKTWNPGPVLSSEKARDRIAVVYRSVDGWIGDVVLIDWDGYTIGYYGRPFEARNKVTDNRHSISHSSSCSLDDVVGERRRIYGRRKRIPCRQSGSPRSHPWLRRSTLWHATRSHTCHSFMIIISAGQEASVASLYR